MSQTAENRITLPDYTRGEEIFNMTSHIVGGALGIAALTLCVVFAAIHHNVWAVVGCSIYGFTLVLLYTMSSVYHGLRPGKGKKVLRVLDHCTINFLIAGTYTPILLCGIRPISAPLSWTIFGIEWGLAALAVTFTAIDLQKFAKPAMACYIGMGWCVIMCWKQALLALGTGGFTFLLLGGIMYTLGALLYGIGKKKRYFHSIFHMFVVAGSVLQFFAIFFYLV